MSDSFETAEAPSSSSNGRRRRKSEPAADQLPPHSIEAEQGILACVLIDNEEPLNEAEERNVTPNWFYDLRHQLLWRAIQGLRIAGSAVDVVTVYQWLKDRSLADQVGGLQYIAGLPDIVPSSSNAVYYLGIVREQMLLREVIRAGAAVIQDAQSIVKGEKTNPEELISRLQRDINRLSEQTSQVAEVRVGQIIMAIMPELENYHRGSAQVTGLTLGLAYFDKLTCGLGGRHGNYIVVSGRPGTGKTSLALQSAVHAALDYVWYDPVLEAREGGGPPIPKTTPEGVPLLTQKVGIPVGIFSYEMAKEALVERMLFTYAQADMQRWRTGFAENKDIENIMTAAHKIAEAKIFIDDNPGPVEALCARARRMFHTLGIKLFIIDYLQLLNTSRRRDDRVQELSEVSGQIRKLSKELNVPFIVLAQMNRDYEKDASRPPRLSDLKDCGSIEQDADLVGFLYKPKLKERQQDQYNAAMEKVFPGGDWSKRPERVNILLAKARYGPCGKAELLFQKSATRFHDWVEWLKDNGEKELAAGERARQQQSGEQPTGDDPGAEDPEMRF